MTRTLAAALAALLAAAGAASGAPPSDPKAASQAPPAQPAAEAHAHDAHAQHGAAAADAPARLVPYATDAPLREAMSRVLVASNAAAPRDATASATLVRTIDESIAHMIANCKLEPEADAVLHGFIGRLATDASTLRQHPADAGALASIRTTLRDYAGAFDHPDFAAPTD